MSTAIDLTEHLISSETMVTGGMLTVKRDQVRLSNGNCAQREYIVHPGAVVVVAMLTNGHVILERQFRYPLRQVFIELPAGKIDVGESVLHTGHRELLEETGYSANKWIKLGLLHPCIGYSDEVIHIYLAQDLYAGEHKRDDDELLEVLNTSIEDCLKMIDNGEITDAKTIIALFFAHNYLTKHGLK